MNCSQVRDHLSFFVYGDLTPAETTAVRDHLAGCAACRVEEAALAGVRRLLDAAPAPGVAVNMPDLYRRAAAHQERRLRHWRGVAVVCGGLAAAVALLAVGLRLEVRLEAHHVMVRWGMPPAVQESSPPVIGPSSPATIMRVSDQRQFAEIQEQIRLLSELVRGQATEGETFERRLANLQAGVDDLRQLTDRRCTSTERDVAALSANQLPLSPKGTVP